MPYKRLTEKRLGELLVEKGLFSRKQLDEALKIWEGRKGSSLSGEVFVELGLATEEDIIRALIEQYRFPHIPLEHCHIDKDVLKLIPEVVAVKYKLIPIDKIGNNLTIAIANPLNAAALKEIAELSGCEVTSFIAKPSAIYEAHETHYRGKSKGSFPTFLGYK